jgi:hypothetical protein
VHHFTETLIVFRGANTARPRPSRRGAVGTPLQAGSPIPRTAGQPGEGRGSRSAGDRAGSAARSVALPVAEQEALAEESPQRHPLPKTEGVEGAMVRGVAGGKTPEMIGAETIIFVGREDLLAPGIEE